VNDDELISTYLDGRLSEREHAAFEARLHADASLRRRVAATQLLVREARQIPALAAPHIFILPRDVVVTKPTPRPSGFQWPTLIFRLGSIAAALLFLVLIGADAVLQPNRANRVMVVTEVASAAFTAPAATVAELVTGIAPSAKSAPLAEVTTPVIVAQFAETASPPNANVGAAGQSAEPPITSAAAPAEMMQTQSDAAAIPTPGLEATAAPIPTHMPVLAPSPTSVPSPTAFVETPPSSQPLATPARAIALVALIAALVLGALGWLRR
jgi:hypothetical protein